MSEWRNRWQPFTQAQTLQLVLFSGEPFVPNDLLLMNRTEEVGCGGFAVGMFPVPGGTWCGAGNLLPSQAPQPPSLLFRVRPKEVQSHTKQTAFSEIYLRIIEAVLSYLLIHTCPY